MQSFGQKCFSTAPFLPLHIILTPLKVLLSLLPSEESGGGGGGWGGGGGTVVFFCFYLFSSGVFIYRHFYQDEIVFFKGLCSRLSYGTVFLTVVMFGFICHQKGADGSKRSCEERNEQGFSAAKPVEIKINNSYFRLVHRYREYIFFSRSFHWLILFSKSSWPTKDNKQKAKTKKFQIYQQSKQNL